MFAAHVKTCAQEIVFSGQGRTDYVTVLQEHYRQAGGGESLNFNVT